MQEPQLGKQYRPWRGNREVLDATLWVQTRASWRDLPEKYPPYQTCHRGFQHLITDTSCHEVRNVEL